MWNLWAWETYWKNLVSTFQCKIEFPLQKEWYTSRKSSSENELRLRAEQLRKKLNTFLDSFDEVRQVCMKSCAWSFWWFSCHRFFDLTACYSKISEYFSCPYLSRLIFFDFLSYPLAIEYNLKLYFFCTHSRLTIFKRCYGLKNFWRFE